MPKKYIYRYTKIYCCYIETGLFSQNLNVSSIYQVKLNLAIIANILPVYFRNFTAENVAQRRHYRIGEKNTLYIQHKFDFVVRHANEDTYLSIHAGK